jgi:hypothetical protein
MQVVFSHARPRPYQSPRTHARLKHDYATWHEDHVQQVLRKTSPRLPFQDGSKFDTAIIIDEAITRSYEFPALVAANGNHVVTFDMGYEIGFDARANRRTSAVTVVLTDRGEVITAHPGTSWSTDQSEA